MIDNSELIRKQFYFNEANDMFFHCQIVQRAKDHPNGNFIVYARLKTRLICQ